MRILRWLSILLGVLLVAAILGWTFRGRLLLHGPPLVRSITEPIGPHRPVAWSTGTSPLPAGERPPNVVVILVDDMGFNDVTYHGGGLAGGSVPTPRIDRLAAEGVVFENGYAGNAVCAPSRAMLLTGRYSTRFGFEFTPAPKAMALVAGTFFARDDRLRATVVDREAARRVPPMGELGLPPEEITLAELLKQRGYHTVHIGKWHLGRAGGMRPEDQGFDESLLMDHGAYLPPDHPDVVNSRQDFDPIDTFLWANVRFSASFNGGERFEPGGYLTDWWTDEAVKVIEANRDRPFFLYLAHWAPHTPLQALRSDYEALAHVRDHRLRVYAAMIRALDRSVGRVLDVLEANGLDENTLVVFTSDNGGAHYLGLPEINRPYRGWKLSLFEGGIHVPFAARWPGRIPAGSRFAAPVSHLDVFATAAAAAGAPLPEDRVIDGVDLLPHVTGEAEGPPHEVLFWRQGHYRVVLSEGWKLQVSAHPERTWLFHLDRDPTEQQDVAARRPERVREMRALLAAHDAQQSPPRWEAFVRVPISIDKTLADPQSPDDEYVYWEN